MAGKADKIAPAVQPRDDLEPSPSLSLVAKAPKTLKGRTLAVLVTDSSDAKAVGTLQRAVKKEGAQLKLIAPRIGTMKNGLTPDMTIDGGPSCLFDAVVLLPGQPDMPALLTSASAVNWLRDAFGHLKAIGHNAPAEALFAKGGLAPGAPGVVAVANGFDGFIALAKQHKIWDRDKLVNPPR
jgi:catalase